MPNRSPEGDPSKDVGRMEGVPGTPRSHPGTPKAEGFRPHKSRGWHDRHKGRRRRDRECRMLAPGAGRRRCWMSSTGVTGAIEPEKLSALMTSDRRKPRAGVYRRRKAGGGSEPHS